MLRTCPFCHQNVLERDYAAHEAQHTRRLPDGQMADHVTVRPEQRFTGSLDKEPRTYLHTSCGGVTEMPEEIIRSALADPFLYNDTSFCTGCSRYVRTSELYWRETGESLLDHSRRLRTEFIQKNRLNPQDFDWGPNGPTRKGAGTNLSSLAPVAIFGGLALLVVLMCGGIAGGAFIFATRKKAPPINFPQPNFQPPQFAAPPITIPPIELPKIEMPEPGGINFTPPTPIESSPSIDPTPLPTFANPPQPFSPSEHMRRSREEHDERMREMKERLQRQSEEMRQRMETMRRGR